jgi:hypothetical protein
MAALEAEQRRENSTASSSETFTRKLRTVQQPHPNDANPNTAESMVKNAHRTASRLGQVLQESLSLGRAFSVST